jgi:hypothetical protein
MLMTDYRRPWVEGGTYFFTLNLAERRGLYPADWTGAAEEAVEVGEWV